MRRVFAPKRDEVTQSLRKLHNVELHNLCPSPSIFRVIISRRMEQSGHVAHVGDKRNAYSVLGGKPERKTSLEIPRHR